MSYFSNIVADARPRFGDGVVALAPMEPAPQLSPLETPGVNGPRQVHDPQVRRDEVGSLSLMTIAATTPELADTAEITADCVQAPESYIESASSTQASLHLESSHATAQGADTEGILDLPPSVTSVRAIETTSHRTAPHATPSSGDGANTRKYGADVAPALDFASALESTMDASRASLARVNDNEAPSRSEALSRRDPTLAMRDRLVSGIESERSMSGRSEPAFETQFDAQAASSRPKASVPPPSLDTPRRHRAQTASERVITPQVHVGRVEVVVQTPSTPSAALANTRKSSNLAARRYLTRL